jgi:PAS domain S-box-containing protein
VRIRLGSGRSGVVKWRQAACRHGSTTREDPLDVTLFEALLSAAPVGAALIDASGRYVWVNQALADMNGRPPADHVGRTLREVGPDLADVGEAFFAQVRAGQVLSGIEIAGETPDQSGRPRTWVQSWYPIDHDGVAAVAVLVWEVTDRREAAAARAASMERLDLALEAGGMGTWDWDLRSGVIHWDVRTAAIFGVALEDFDGTFEAFARLVHPADVDLLTAAVEQAIESRGELRREYRTIPSTGDVRWVSVRGRVIVGPDGEPDAMVGVIQDRTDTHSQGEALTRTLEAIDEAFVSIDRDWRFTYVNGRAEQILECSREVLVGAELWDLFPATIGSLFEHHYRSVMEDRAPRTFEAYFAPLDVWVEVRAYPDDEGIAVYFRDVSARKRAEEQRAAEAAREHDAHEAAARLLDVVDHMHAHTDPSDAMLAACEAGIAVFRCMRVSIWRVDADGGVLLAQVGGVPLPSDARMAVHELIGMTEALEANEPRFFLEEGEAVLSAAERELARHVGARSFVYAPVELGGGAGTLLAVINWAEHIPTLHPAMLDVTGRYAQQTALALEQARRRQAQIDAARLGAQLQSSLLPAPVTSIAGFEIASLYQPGERRLLLGGDFYDVVARPDGCLGVVIGDVTGHGPEAAAIGASLRAGWRTLALRGTSPVDTVAALDALLRAERGTDEQLVSICCACVDPSGAAVRVASAGHPPPLLSTEDGTDAVPVPIGLLLGLPVEEPRWEEASISLPERWALLLYTDGLPEARDGLGAAERIGFREFAAQVAMQGPLDASDPASMLRDLQAAVRARSGQPIEDDVALLLVRRG